MMEPRHHMARAEEYDRVRQALLHIATVLGDWMDQVTVIGGIVPSLLVAPEKLAPGVEAHPGTADLDLALQLSVLSDEGYANISDLLRKSGYQPDQKAPERIRRQTWRTNPKLGPVVTVDFLIARSANQPLGARIQHLQTDWSAVIADGLQLVERDRRQVTLSGLTIRSEFAERLVWVCGPASFVVLKARAIHLREKAKDAFDVHYVLTHWEAGIDSIAMDLSKMLDDPDAAEAVAILERAYRTVDSIGPSRTASFLFGNQSSDRSEDFDEVAADAYGAVQRLLTKLRPLT